MARPTMISVLIHEAPETAVEAILKAHRKTKGNTVHAARELGVSHRTLRRWIVQLGCQAKIDELRES